jgi:hypothetical protein
MKTPMQELIEKFDNGILLPSNWREKYIKKEKQMIIYVFNDGRKIQTKLIKNMILLEESEDKTDYISEAEQYYNETFKP